MRQSSLPGSLEVNSIRCSARPSGPAYSTFFAASKLTSSTSIATATLSSTRLGPDEGDAALREPHVRAFDVTRRPMRSWLAVEPEGVEGDDQLKGWIERATKFVRTLPGKSKE